MTFYVFSTKAPFVNNITRMVVNAFSSAKEVNTPDAEQSFKTLNELWVALGQNAKNFTESEYFFGTQQKIFGDGFLSNGEFVGIYADGKPLPKDLTHFTITLEQGYGIRRRYTTIANMFTQQGKCYIKIANAYLTLLKPSTVPTKGNLDFNAYRVW